MPSVLNYVEQGGAKTVIGGEIDITGTLSIDSTEVTSTAAELNILDGVTATAAELNEYSLTVDMTDISAGGSVWVAVPHAGAITKLYSVINGAITVGDATITLELGGTEVTDSTLVIANSGSAAGIVDSSTPSALNVVAAGDAIEVISDAGSTDACRATFTIVITR